MVKHKKEKQQTLEATLGRPRVRPVIKTPKAKGESKAAALASSSPAGGKSSPRAPPSSFMPSSQVGGSARKRRAVLADESSEEETSEGDEVLRLPVRERRRGKRPRPVSSSSSSGILTTRRGDGSEDEEDEEEGEDMLPVTPTARRKRRRVVDESDDDDEPLASSAIKRRRLVRRNGPQSPTKEGQKESEDDEPAPSLSATASRTRRKPLTKKEKARELLRRKRAGEVIHEEDETSSSEEGEPGKRAMYDTDSDHLALNEFEDDEEGVPDSKEEEKKKKEDKGKRRRVVGSGDEGSDESIDDFVVDDSDAPLGAPEDALLNMPLEFTKHSHKPLKEHFRDAIEWLVQFKINPGFSEKEHPLYRMAWKKLDDEVRGLATSKFASAAWKKDFYMALRARPYYASEELPKGDMLEARSCGACGRSGHPARHIFTLTGTAYFKDTTKLDRFLQPVELDSDSDSEPELSGSEPHDVDEDGNHIPKETNQWFVGVVCNSNAETAHNLIHWKYALLDWVDTRLHEEGYMAPSKLAERERMRPKQKYKLVDSILEEWVEKKVVKALYGDFKGTIELARNKKTTGRYR
ncbi:hypothetical protein N658DRAFT_460708 [Parathielavia hyrcaniae]|uniref:DUF4211 domain-containing protein n=1 Tax=Parathielavia hyrcaniae TaxID=113614 RepID=A0AAN6Q9V0_9PEZI|nr:hypothetical protein N658DRAFT_460708 [Parathielavia hyrcaniae]